MEHLHDVLLMLIENLNIMIEDLLSLISLVLTTNQKSVREKSDDLEPTHENPSDIEPMVGVEVGVKSEGRVESAEYSHVTDPAWRDAMDKKYVCDPSDPHSKFIVPEDLIEDGLVPGVYIMGM